MLTREMYTDQPANVIFFIPTKKRNILKRLIRRIKRKMRRMKTFVKSKYPNHWYDGLLDELEIELKEFK